MKAYDPPLELAQDNKIERYGIELFTGLNGVLEDEENWTQLSLEQFAAGYSDADDIYDTLE